jgi:uncharacterized membrane protein
VSAFSFTNTDEEGPIRKRNMGSIGPFSEQLCRQVASATIARGQVNWFNTERRITLAELIVVGFKKDMYRASKVLNDLVDLKDDWVVDLHGAVAAYRDFGGKLRVDRSYQMLTTGQGAGWGGFWGLVIGTTLATLAIPFTAGASAAAAGAALASGAITGTAIGAGVGASEASSWKDEFGIPDDFVQQVKALIQPGDSAIFAILRVVNPDVVADQFRGYGGTILRTTLSRDQQAKVEKVLGASAR